EKRKYPINDAAHVRAALSRVADPSNDQCGREKIIAAARRMGIGDHKGFNDNDLVLWAAIEYPAAEITKDDDGEEQFIVKVLTTADMPGAEIDTPPVAEPDGQESEETPETPETASDTEDEETDPASGQKALPFEASDVNALASHARD